MDVIMAIRTTGGEVKRSLSRAGAAAMIAWAASATPAAHAQAYPVKPIRIIVPVAAGGNLDIVARAVGATPWTPFLRLCVAMIVHVQARDDYKTSIDVQLLHRRLTEGRRRLRVAALCYADLYESPEIGRAHV